MNHVVRKFIFVSHVLSARASFECRLSNISIKPSLEDDTALAQWAVAPVCSSHGEVAASAGRQADVFFCHLVGIITWSHNHSTCQHNKAGGKELGGRQTQETTQGKTGGNKDNSNLQFAFESVFFLILIYL